MSRLLLSAFFLASVFISHSQTLRVSDPVCEYRDNLLGTDVVKPRFSWRLENGKNTNVIQTAYEIRVAKDAATLARGKGLIWESGRVPSDQSQFIVYGGPAPRSKERFYWQVRVWDNHKNTSPWSEVGFWEMGLLDQSDWKGKWITSGLAGDSINGPVPLFRKTFTLQRDVAAARVYVTARGLYEAFINGQRVGDGWLTPGWTSYSNRIQYQVYDVTNLVGNGNNVVGAIVGNGWYRGPLAWEHNQGIYGKETALLFQLEITFTDGSSEMVVSDDSWKTSLGPWLSSEIYHGERYDARKEKEGWLQAGYDDRNWMPAKISQQPSAELIATYGPLVTRHETFKPVKIFTTPKGELVADFGQNLVGLLQFRLRGKAGQTITIHHAEVLDKDGNFYIDNLRAAKQKIEYTFKGSGEEVYEPHLTFMGFRYVRLQGYSGQLQPADLTATALYSDMMPTGNFECSNPLVNQLQHNIQWGQKGNFLDVPTDCPQRDERLGWTGDAQVFSRTAAFNMNTASFFSKWLKDLAADQRDDGAVPFVIPNVLNQNAAASAGWADAATIIPWTMYNAFGDVRVLENQYESMKAWVGYMEAQSVNNLWNTGFHFGDWLFYRPFDDNDGRSAVTDKYLIAQSFFIYSTELLLQAAKVLGKTDDVSKYSDLVSKIKEAYLKEYVTPSGRLVSGTQTAYVLALNFDILPEYLRAATATRLADNVKAYGNHLTTGFLGTPYLCHVLSRFGYTQLAYSLLMQETYPSWLYPVKMGATTIWERWDGIKPDGSFQTPGMNSFNHYAYGAIGDWMYRTVAGIREAAPGYKKIIIAPEPGGGLTNASASLMSPYGLIKSGWKIQNGIFRLEVTVPPNATADVVLPDVSGLTATPSLTPQRQNGKAHFAIGSGTYRFEHPAGNVN